MSVLYILLALVVLLVMITVHELGHYVAGKIFGFKINEFSIGFGPAIYKRTKKDGEIFAVRALPLGGYCAFDGDDFTEEEEEKNAPESEPFAEMKTEETQNEGGMVEVKEQPQDEYPEPQGAQFNDQAPWKRIIVLMSVDFRNYNHKNSQLH